MSGPTTDAQAIVDAGIASAEPHVLDDDVRTAFVVPAGGKVSVIDRPRDDELDAPRRVLGNTTVFNADGLAHLWGKYSSDASELYADPVGHRLTAVFNADASGEDAGHRDHRAELVCRLTPAWQAWLQRDGRLIDQTDFAQFIEDRLAEIVEPSGADMLELATTFESSSQVEFKSATILSSSQRALHYEETSTAKAGQKGDIEIPASFVVALQPFEGGDAYRVTARLRYKIAHGQLAIGYRLERPDIVLDTAFGDVRTAVAEATGAEILLGTPPAERYPRPDSNGLLR